MLFFEPVEDYEKIFPPQIVGMIKVLAALGFKDGVDHDLDLINRGLKIHFVERAGKICYDGKVAGYPRGVKNQE
jgi:hypothetical protein